MSKPQFAILRFAKYKGPEISNIEAHNERTKDEYASNPDIDKSRSCLNFHLLEPERKYRAEAERQIKDAGCRTRSDSVRVVEALVTATPEFFKGKKKDEIKALEERYAKAECPVVSNNSAHRHTPDVPMIIPEINPQHIEIIPAQRERLGTKRGFIAVKSNCSLQSYLPAMAVVNMKYPIDHALVTTYQAISGAGKTFKTWPEMVDNLIPYIGGEEMKSEVEPNKVLGKIEGKEIVPSTELQIECQTYRVPVSNGHTAAIFFSFKDSANKPSVEEIEKMWAEYKGVPQELNLPHAPKQFIHVYTEKDAPDQPQIKTAREIDGGMAISCGRLRESTQYDYKMVSMSHNTLRGAAGGAVLLAELLTAKGYMD